MNKDDWVIYEDPLATNPPEPFCMDLLYAFFDDLSRYFF